MSKVFDAIKDRRSIRKYKDCPVPKEIIEEILTAAGWAPSAHNAQPWRFIILVDISVKRKLAEDMANKWAVDMEKDGAKIEEEVHKVRIERFASAPVVILACLTMEGMTQQLDAERQNVERDLAVQSLGAALQNLLLAAHVKGLGACWFCAPSFCKETVKNTLKIPDAVEPAALILMGYPDEKPTGPPRKVLGDYCFRDEWGKKL
jgi:F420 biosynthesis protein FbiB-like protein